jgi:hypothetical protein
MGYESGQAGDNQIGLLASAEVGTLLRVRVPWGRLRGSNWHRQVMPARRALLHVRGSEERPRSFQGMIWTWWRRRLLSPMILNSCRILGRDLSAPSIGCQRAGRSIVRLVRDNRKRRRPLRTQTGRYGDSVPGLKLLKGNHYRHQV